MDPEGDSAAGVAPLHGCRQQASAWGEAAAAPAARRPGMTMGRRAMSLHLSPQPSLDEWVGDGGLRSRAALLAEANKPRDPDSDSD